MIGMGQRAEAKFAADMAVLVQRARDWMPLTLHEATLLSMHLLSELDDAREAWQTENNVHRETQDQLLGQLKAKVRLMDQNHDLNVELANYQTKLCLSQDDMRNLKEELKRVQCSSWFFFAAAVMFAAVAVLK